MGITYSKLFSTLPDSTIWAEPNPTRICWITMLAMADQFGRVHSSIPGLANRARITLEETEIALATFLAPDKYSRTKDNDGRRIAELETGGGWRLLNYAKFRDLQDDERKRELTAARVRRHRAKHRVTPNVTLSNALSRDVTQCNPIADTDTEAITTAVAVTEPSEEEISPEMVAAAVKDELALGGVPVMICLMDIARSRLKAGADPTTLRNGLVRAWRDYRKAIPQLEWAYGSPESFFRSDKWDDSTLWPWKSGGPRKLKAVSE